MCACNTGERRVCWWVSGSVPASGAGLRSQELGTLGSRSDVKRNGVFNINFWRGSPFMVVYLLAYIFCSQAFRLIRQDQAAPATSVSMSRGFGPCWTVHAGTHCSVCTFIWWAHAPVGSAHSALLLAECGDKNLCQPCCYSTAGLGSFSWRF